jgi:hypothetical protein
MKLNCDFKGMCVGKPSPRKSQDGKSTYYDIGVTVLSTGEAGTFSCTEELYALVDLLKEYQFIAQYNSDYKTFRLIGCNHLGNEQKK